MVMTPDKCGVSDVLSRMARLGLGGPVGGGRQYMSWIHEDDFTAAVRFIIDDDVVPGLLTAAGSGFRHGTWPEAARDLVQRTRRRDTARSRGGRPDERTKRCD
jgi:NAD dependent epimerase/dehydratase family enzyme